MGGVFSIREEHINNLSAADCVRLFGELLHSDARRLNLPVSKVGFSTKTIPDGGIDATIEGGLSEEGDLIVDAESFYQIKAGKTFSPWQESEIKNELLGGKDPAIASLGSEVQRCFERNGTYILACMKVQLTPEQKTKAEGHLTKTLASCGIPNPRARVWGQDKIIGAIARFPSLVRRLTGRDGSIFLSHRGWSASREMQRELVLGQKQDGFIKAVRDALLEDSERSIHLNIHGEPGVGKTRLVLESTRDPFLAPLVIYCSSPKELRARPLFNEIIEDPELHCVLVVDECDHLERADVWDRLWDCGSRVKLVTISHEYREADETTQQMETPRLDDSQIQEIIGKHHDDQPAAERLSRICGGIPRLAHMIVWDLQNNPGELLRGSQQAFAFFDRYLNQGEDPSSERVSQRKTILMTGALFTKFGNARYFKDEFKAVHGIVMQIDAAVTLHKFQEHVQDLQSRKILQGQDALYISPKALHLWLWMEWWGTYRASFPFEELVKNLPAKLRRRFFDMFKHAGSSDAAKGVVRELFGGGGPLSGSDSVKTGLGADLFNSLSSADPAAAVDYLERTVGTWSEGELKGFSAGRRSVLRGLERIVFEEELFARGGALLRSLAENENEPWSNNATGLFAGLFSLGPGRASATKTPPPARIQLLRETLCSENAGRRCLGLKACASALETAHASHPPGSPDGLRPGRGGWEPKTRGEWAGAYKSVIELMVERLRALPPEDGRKCASIISGSSRGLIRAFPFMAGYVVAKLREIKDFTDKEAMLQNISDILELEKEKLPPEAKSKLERLQTDVAGTDYPSLLKRYVGMSITADANGNGYEGGVLERMRELAGMSLDARRLEPELPWLTTRDAKHGYVFGQELAKKDTKLALLQSLLEAQRAAGDHGSGLLMGGYLRVVSENDRGRWAEIMEGVSQDPKLLRYFAEVARLSGIDDKTGILILDLVESRQIRADELGRFATGGAVNRLSEGVVARWIEHMVGTNEQKTVFGAASLLYFYFVHRSEKTLNLELALKLLLHDAFLGKKTAVARDPMIVHSWKETASKLIGQYPEQSLALSEKILGGMGGDSYVPHRNPGALEILDSIALERPDDVWGQVTKYASLPLDERGYAIVRWMRGGPSGGSGGFLDRVDFEKICDWVDHDPRRLAPCVAMHCKPELSPASFARKLLIRYGDEDGVQDALAANFSTEGFSGRGSAHLQKKEERLLAYRERDGDVNVRNWIDSYVKSIDESITREKLREERGF